MNGILKLALLSATLAIVGCNEKVAPELQNGAAASTTIPTAVPPSEYYFSLTNASNPLLNYVVHQTGDGNYNKKCEVRLSLPLSNALYKAASPDPEGLSDVTCYFEAEELALYLTGLAMKIDTSPNTCEYIGYSPYSYYNRMPGNSSSNIYKVSCDKTLVSPTDILDATDGSDATDVTANLGTDGTPVICGEYLDKTITPTNQRRSFSVDDESDLCRFNYDDGDSEKCDIGEINLTEISITKDDTTLDMSATATTRKIKCGGKAYNCIKGPITQVSGIKGTVVNEYTPTALNQNFTKTWTLAGLIGVQFPGSWEYVNFRRDLASTSINYGDSTNQDTTTYTPLFAGIKDFNPELLDRYATNRKMDGSPLISSTTYTKWSYVYHNGLTSGVKQQLARPLAAEPYLGMPGYRTNPFYTFYCLDGAWDIKARIRVMVRDWDRVYPSDANMELISDINLAGLGRSRQDVSTSEELGDDGDPLNMYNDHYDWDDIMPMLTDGTTWSPTPELPTYPDGFFNPYIFPRVMKDQ